MGKKIDPKRVEAALSKVIDESSFIQQVLIDVLEWPIDPKVKSVEEIAYDWTKDELRAANLDKRIVEGRIRQLALPDCPWGIFIVEFNNPDVFQSGRGMTVSLRQVLSGLVPKQKKAANLPSFFREHLLFICTHKYKYFRYVHFKDPGAQFKQPPLASFGWWPGDSTKTVSTYNLPHLVFLDATATVDDWIDEWTAAFDVERVTKKFYTDYKEIHSGFQEKLVAVPAADCAWLASVLLNRLMFVYFLQKKGFLDGGNESYLEDKLTASKGKDRFYTDFLTLLFFEGFAKPKEKRSAEAKAKLGEIRYLNGGLFLKHPIEQRAANAGKTVSLPDSVFHELFELFGSFSWNLNDKPGGQDNEINPDVLGYIVEKYINQKAFGAYYTRPEITGYLCERTIHRLILDAVNTPEPIIASMKKSGLPVRSFKSLGDMLKKLDPALAAKLLEDVLPGLALLDPACGSGAFLVAAMKALIDIYAAVFGWIKFNGSPALKTHLKKIEAKHSSLDYFIKKRIISDNLFGVDIMEEAVEIARLRLFLALAASANTVEELEPLPNIDFNILRGNSLIGLTHVDGKGFSRKNLFLPPYEQVLKDRDRQLHAYRNAAEYMDDLTALRDKIADVNAQAQETLDDILLDNFTELRIKYEQATWDDKEGSEGKPQKRPLKLEDIQALHPFHWAFAFDAVMARGGFDAIITNPPWEIVKPNSKEFFEQHSELVTKKSMSIHDFQDEQGKLLKDKDIRSAWLDYLSSYPHQNAYFRFASEYKNQIGTVNGKKVGSDLNLYKLFVERCFRLLRSGGLCGIVIPSGIYTDLGAKQLRIMLFDEATIDGLFGIENRLGVFEDVHRMFKFVVLTFAHIGKTAEFPAAFMRHEVSELERFPAEGSLPISVELVKKLSPDSLSVMEFKNLKDVSIFQKLAAFPLLRGDQRGWDLEIFGEEFHMNRSAGLFLKKASSLTLFEGGMIWQFDHKYSEPQYWVKESSIMAEFNDKRIKRINGKPITDGTIKNDYETSRIAIRKIASNTNERTLITTIIPRNAVAGNSLSVHFPFFHESGRQNELRFTGQDLFVMVSLLNSFVADYALRSRMTTNVNSFYLYQLPIPRPQHNGQGYLQLVERSAKLICTTSEFDELAKAAGLNPPNHHGGVTDPAERAKLRAQLDAMVAHLYRLTEEEFAHILATFPIVPEETKQSAMDEFVRMRDSGRAAVFNPDLLKTAAASDPAQAVRDLVAAGESATVEFKSSARWNVLAKQGPDKKMEQIIAKTVSAFLNTSGGTLVIGVEDDGKVYGLADDFRLCGRKGRDGFELWLMQMLLKEFGKDASSQLSVTFCELGASDASKPSGSADVCVVIAEPSPKPRFVVEENREEFYIRTGNATNRLKPSELINYWKQRWPEGLSEDAS